MQDIVKVIVISTLAAIGLFFGFIFLMVLFNIPAWLGSFINTANGQYTGVLVENRTHGIIFKTHGVHLKTDGFTSKFEDFCVTDDKVFEQIQQLPAEKKVTVIYKSKLSTPSWQCDSEDSSDIIIAIK